MASRRSRSKAIAVLGNELDELLYEIAPFMGPRMDILQSTEFCYISVDIAGTDREDLSLKVQGKTLWIEGCIKDCFEDRNIKVLVSERYYGSFKRKVDLPENSLLDKIEAEYQKGVLLIKVPFLK